MLPTQRVDQHVGNRSEDERSQSGTADGNSRGQRSQPFEVHRYAHDGRQVDQTQAHAGTEPDRDEQEEYALGEDTDGQADCGQDGTGNRYRSAAEPVHQGRRDGSWKWRGTYWALANNVVYWAGHLM